MEYAVKFGTSSLVSYPIYNYLYSGKGINAFGSTWNLPIALSVLSASGFLISELVHDQLFPALHVSDKFATPVSGAMNIASNYAAQNAMLMVLNSNAPQEIGQSKLLMGAAASAMASSYLYNQFVAPMYGYNSHTLSSY